MLLQRQVVAARLSLQQQLGLVGDLAGLLFSPLVLTNPQQLTRQARSHCSVCAAAAKVCSDCGSKEATEEGTQGRRAQVLAASG